MIHSRTRKRSWFSRYSIASYPPFVLPLPTRLRFEHGRALRLLCIRKVRWSGRCGMGTPFELVRLLADWGFNFRPFWCCFAPCTVIYGPLGYWYQYPTVLRCRPKKYALWSYSYSSSRVRALYIMMYVVLTFLTVAERQLYYFPPEPRIVSDNSRRSLDYISWLSRIENANLSYENGRLSIRSENYRPFKAVP